MNLFFIKKSFKLFILFFSIFFSNSLIAQDTDGDGILNSIDLDDDNDGIPDILERNVVTAINYTAASSGTASNGAISTTLTITPDAANTNGYTSTNPSYANANSTLELTYGSFNTFPDRYAFTVNTASTTSGYLTQVRLYQRNNPAAAGNNEASTYTITWTGGVGNAVFNDPKTPGIVGTTGASPTGDYRYGAPPSFNVNNGQIEGLQTVGEITNGGSFVVYNINNSSAQWYIDFPIGATNIKITKVVRNGATATTATATGVYQTVRTELNAMPSTAGIDANYPNFGRVNGLDSGESFGEFNAIQVNFIRDTDNDGIPNHLDYDSDNDGCPDAIEGGDNITQSMLNASNAIATDINGVINGSNIATVDAQGVPVITNSGSIYNIDGQVQGQTLGQSTTVNPSAVAGTASANQVICFSNTPSSIALTGFVGAIQWQSSSDNISFVNISGANSSTYSPSALTSTTYYRAIVTSVGGCTAISNVVTITVNNCIDAINDTFASVIAGTTTATSVIVNDKNNSGTAAVIGTAAGQVSISTATDASGTAGSWPTGFTLNADGTISVATGTAAGTYTLYYKICNQTAGTPCDTAAVTLTVPLDSDFDGLIDSTDLDDDNDGILDSIECNPSNNRSDYSNITPAMLGIVANTINTGSIGPIDVSNQFGYAANSGAVLIKINNYRTDGTNTFVVSSTITTSIEVTGIMQSKIIINHGAGINGSYRDGITSLDGITYTFLDQSTLTAGFVSGSSGLSYYVDNTNPVGTTAGTNMNWVSNDYAKNVAVFSTFPTANNRFFIYLWTECDYDKDLITNRLDLDSDNDGCLDAIEGGANITTAQLVNAPSSLSVGSGSTALNQNLCATITCVDSNGVPTLTPGGQLAGESYNSAIKSGCFCYKPAQTTGTTLDTNHGISALGRAGADNGNWPMVRKGAWTVLEAKTKGFVINRLTNALI